MNQGLSGSMLAAIVIPLAIALIGLIAVAVRRYRAQEYSVDQGQLDTLLKEWRGPAELVSKSTPRDVRYTGKAYGLFGMVGVIIAAGVFGAALFYPGIQRDLDQAKLIEREGVASHGTIVDRSVRRGKSNSYSVTYSYDVNGHQYSSTAGVPGRAYRQMNIGALTPIHYAASRPEVSRADDALRDPPMLRFLVIVPGLLLLIIPFMAMNQKKLLSLGTPVGAIAIRVAPTKGGMAVHFRYLDVNGTVVAGHDVVPSRRAPTLGDALTIVVDPDNPRRRKLYPMALVHLAD